MSLRDMLFWFFLTLFGTGTYVIYGSQSAGGEVWGIAMIIVGFAGMVGCAWPHLRDPLTGKVQLTWTLVQRIVHEPLYRKAAIRITAAYIVISIIAIGGRRIYRRYYPSPIQPAITDTSGPLLPLEPLQPLTVSQIKLVFKDQSIGKTSSPQAVTVINRANAPRIISGINISGNFAQTNDCPQELMVGDSCNFEVTFTPVAVGLTHGSLAISCIDPLFSTITLWATVDFSASGKTDSVKLQTPRKIPQTTFLGVHKPTETVTIPPNSNAVISPGPVSAKDMANLDQMERENAEATLHVDTQPEKVTLHDLFLTDLSSGNVTTNRSGFTIRTDPSGVLTHIEFIVVRQLEMGTKYLKFYVPYTSETPHLCVTLADKYTVALNDFMEGRVETGKANPGDSEQTSSQSLVFSDRVFIYHETYLSLEQIIDVRNASKQRGITVVLRSSDYAESKQKDLTIKRLQKQ